VAQFQKAIVLEFGVRFGDGIGADHQFFGESSNAGSLVAILQRASLRAVANLLH